VSVGHIFKDRVQIGSECVIMTYRVFKGVQVFQGLIPFIDGKVIQKEGPGDCQAPLIKASYVITAHSDHTRRAQHTGANFP
jgi:hypothetical protein